MNVSAHDIIAWDDRCGLPWGHSANFFLVPAINYGPFRALTLPANLYKKTLKLWHKPKYKFVIYIDLDIIVTHLLGYSADYPSKSHREFNEVFHGIVASLYP